MKIRLRALLLAAPEMLVATACGSNSTGGSASPGSGTGSPATSPATSKVALAETGATELYPLMNLWAPAYNAKYPNVSITTGSTGSGAGISQAAAGAVNVGASGAYLSDGDMSAHKGLMNIALAISAEQVNYNLPGVTEHLRLNGKALAAMYRGTIKTWNDPQIAALNPGENLPATPGCVAYIGASYSDQAAQKGLGEAQLANASGNYLLPDANSIGAEAAGFAAQTPANEVISLINGPAADGYPIVNYEYAIVYSNQKDPAVARTIQAFLHWTVTDGNNRSFLDQFHFQPLPAPVEKLSDAQIAQINS